MSQHPGHRLDVHAVLKGQGGERVPEVVEPDFGQSRPLQNPVEHMEHAVWGDRAAGGRGEYPWAAAGFISLLFQNLDGVLRQRQCAVGVLRLERGLHYLAVDPGDLPFHPEVE